MKTLKIFIALIAITISANAQFTKAELQVNGLTCSMCSKATEKALRTLGFISDVKADLNKNVFSLTFNSNTPVNLDLINKKVQGAGFFVNSLKATFNFSNIQISSGYFTYAGNTYQLVNSANKQLDGPTTVTVVDKGFAPPSVYKKYAAGPDNMAKPGRVYHLAI